MIMRRLWPTARRSPAADRNSVESVHYVDGRRRDDNGCCGGLFLLRHWSRQLVRSSLAPVPRTLKRPATTSCRLKENGFYDGVVPVEHVATGVRDRDEIDFNRYLVDSQDISRYCSEPASTSPASISRLNP